MVKIDARKILVIKRDALGDLISVTPFLEVLRRIFPKAEISFVVGSWSQAVLRNNPHLDRLMVVDSQAWQKPIRKFWERHKLIRRLRPENIDTVFVLQGPAPFRFWENVALALGARHRIGFRAWHSNTSLTHSVELPRFTHHVFQVLKKNRADLFLDLLRAIGVDDTANSGNRLYWSARDEKFSRKVLADHKFSDSSLVAIAPGGATNPGMTQLGKRWPLARFQALIALILARTKMDIVLIGGPTDRSLGATIIKKLRSDDRARVLNATATATVHQSAALISRARVFIGNDSGPLHIASATKTPIVGIFGPTNPVVDGPYQSAGKILYHQTLFSPCYTSGCAGHQLCITQVSVEEVWQALGEILKK